MASTFERISNYMNNLDNITRSLRQKKSQISTSVDNVEFRNQITTQIDNGKNLIRDTKQLLGGQFERNDKPKVVKLNTQFKQLTTDFEKEATEILNLQLDNAIGTGGRSHSLSVNSRKDSYSFKSNNNGYDNSKISLSNAEPVEDMIVQEYNNEVKKLVEELTAIRDITNDLGELVGEQGQQLRVADQNVEIAKMDVEQGGKELGQARFPLFLAYNGPSSLVKIFDKTYKINSQQYGNLYSAYAIPNVVMVFLGGILVDIFGPNKCSIAFSSIMTLSTILAALSATPPRYGLLLFSRVLLGIGGETVLVCVAYFMSTWFTPEEMPFFMGLEATWMQFASLMAFGLLPSLYSVSNFEFTIWFIAIIAIMGLVLNLVFILLQKRLKQGLQIPSNNNDDPSKKNQMDGIELEKLEESENIKDNLVLADREDNLLQNGNKVGSILSSSTNSSEEDFQNVDLINENINTKNKNQSTLIRIWTELKKALNLITFIPKRMWILTAISFFGYSAFFGLDIICTDFVIEKYNYSDQKAALMMAAETFFTGVTSPIFGYINNRYRKKIISMGVGSFLIAFGLLLIAVTYMIPLPWIILSGLGYAMLNNALMSSVPLLVEEKVIGTAYGLVGTSYNVGLVIFPAILGAFREWTVEHVFAKERILVPTSFLHP
eukprot:gene2303-2842_t